MGCSAVGLDERRLVLTENEDTENIVNKDGPKLFSLHQGHLDNWAKCFIKKKMMDPKIFCHNKVW